MKETLYTKLKENAPYWKSIDLNRGETEMPDINELLKRDRESPRLNESQYYTVTRLQGGDGIAEKRDVILTIGGSQLLVGAEYFDFFQLIHGQYVRARI